MCHDAASAIVDLSSGEVQYRRHEVWLGKSTADRQYRRAETHRCVNFFWNPLNWTFIAFQRHALLRRHAAQEMTDEMVCVIEVAADSLLTNPLTYWGASAGNLAKGSRPYFELAKLQAHPQFDWPAVFSPELPAFSNRVADRQAAELVVFRGNGLRSEPIPWSDALRVLIPERRPLGREAQRTLSAAGVPVSRSDIYRDERDLLRSWRGFVSSLDDFRRTVDGAVAGKIEASFRDLLAFEASVGTPHRAPYEFSSDLQAYDRHGIGHTARVMFWTRFLRCYDDAPLPGELDLCMLAALIHDLGRDGNSEEGTHGLAAAARFTHIIGAQLASSDDDSAARVLNAVKWHCRDDDDCPMEKRDLVWLTLKDADALDRGRFAWPTKQGGCDRSFLRAGMLRDRDHQLSLPWVAFHLARMTKNMSWSETPCSDLFLRFFAGLRVAEQEGVFQSEPGEGLALQLLERLTPLDGEVRRG
jgi:hypothetical protein